MPPAGATHNGSRGGRRHGEPARGQRYGAFGGRVSKDASCRTGDIAIGGLPIPCPVPERRTITSRLAVMAHCIRPPDLGCAECCIYRGIA